MPKFRLELRLTTGIRFDSPVEAWEVKFDEDASVTDMAVRLVELQEELIHACVEVKQIQLEE